MNQHGTPENLRPPWRKGESGNLGGRPKKPPFAIVIDTEGMQVTKMAGSTWTVVRGYLGTTPAAHTVANSTTKLVMSNPLATPLTVPVACLNYDGTAAASCPYNTGKQTGTQIQPQMCLTGLPTDNSPNPGFTVHGIDIGDGGWSSP